MHRFSFSRPITGGRPRTPIRGLPLVLAAGLALTASACMTPAAKQSSAAGADRQAASKSNGAQEEGKEQGKTQSWWQRMTRSRESGEKPWVYGDVRQGKGLLSNDKDGYTLYRQGEGGSSDPSKPSKVRR